MLAAAAAKPSGTPRDMAEFASKVQRVARRAVGKARDIVLGRSATAMRVGEFRLGGEPHRWMYDRLSLARILTTAGFGNVRVICASESAIPDFALYNLDTEPDGTVYKPDSLFVEATKLREPS